MVLSLLARTIIAAFLLFGLSFSLGLAYESLTDPFGGNYVTIILSLFGAFGFLALLIYFLALVVR